VNELGLTSELQAIISLTRERITDLVALNVEAWEDEYDPNQLHLCLVAWRSGPARVDLETWNEWADGLVRTMPPAVARWFSLDLAYRE
jgi:hypothetical protein